MALQQKKPVKDAHITAKITLGKGDDGGFQIAAELHGQIEGLSREETQALMEAAHRVCPYSKATRGNVPVTLWSPTQVGVSAVCEASRARRRSIIQAAKTPIS